MFLPALLLMDSAYSGRFDDSLGGTSSAWFLPSGRSCWVPSKSTLRSSWSSRVPSALSLSPPGDGTRVRLSLLGLVPHPVGVVPCPRRMVPPFPSGPHFFHVFSWIPGPPSVVGIFWHSAAVLLTFRGCPFRNFLCSGIPGFSLLETGGSLSCGDLDVSVTSLTDILSRSLSPGSTDLFFTLPPSI